MRLPLGAVIGAAGHDDLHHRRTNFRVRSPITELGSSVYVFVLVVLRAGPVRAQLDDRFVKVHADAAAHADHHRLAVHGFCAFLKMRHQIGGHEGEAFRIAHQRLQRGPLGFELFLLRQFLAFGDLLKLRVQLRQRAGVQAQLGDAALVIDRHRGLVGDGALDVVDADVIAEDRPCVRVRLLDGRAGEADEARVRQGIAHVAGETVDEIVLRTVRFVRDDDDVPARRQRKKQQGHPERWPCDARKGCV